MKPNKHKDQKKLKKILDTVFIGFLRGDGGWLVGDSTH